jgi:hypothetical protein
MMKIHEAVELSTGRYVVKTIVSWDRELAQGTIASGIDAEPDRVSIQ